MGESHDLLLAACSLLLACRVPFTLTRPTCEPSCWQVGRAKFARGQPVEVFRTDGTWSLATVTDYDGEGCTYTVALPDGREKHLLEESEMRIPRFLTAGGSQPGPI